MAPRCGLGPEESAFFEKDVHARTPSRMTSPLQGYRERRRGTPSLSYLAASNPARSSASVISFRGRIPLFGTPTSAVLSSIDTMT